MFEKNQQPLLWHSFLRPNWMQILTSRFNRPPFDQEGLTEDCNIIGRVIKDRKKQWRSTWKREHRKKKQTTPPTSPQNKKCTFLYIETWIHNRRFEGHQCQSSIHNTTINKDIAISAHISDHLQSYFKHSRVLWLEIRIYGSVTREYRNSGNCSFVVHIHVMLHCNKFLFNNQPHALIIQIYWIIKLYMFRASSLYVYTFLYYTGRIYHTLWDNLLFYCCNLYISQNFTMYFNNTIHMYILVILPTY
jgi:hypothetical protein